jgi:acetolactate decarboxylase
LARLLPLVVASLFHACLSLAAAGEAAPDVAFHYSTINALLRGLYDGDMTIADLSHHGDHGLGTVNGLDGELIIVDGVAYQLRADGVVHRLDGSESTPFAVVAGFDVDEEIPLPANLDMTGMQSFLDGEIGNPNYSKPFASTARFRRSPFAAFQDKRRPIGPLPTW